MPGVPGRSDHLVHRHALPEPFIHRFRQPRSNGLLDPQPLDVQSRIRVSPELARLADLQAGVVTTEQAVGLGQTRHSLARLVDGGSWQRLASGLYLTIPTPADFSALAWGGVLLGGEQARLGPRASGHLHGLLSTPPETVDVLVPDGRRVRVTGPWQFIRDGSTRRSTRVVGSPPRLRVDDTVLDLTSQSPAPDVVTVVTRAVQGRRTTAAGLLTALYRRQRHPHRALLRGMLEDVADGAESALELLYLCDVERPHQLPVGNRQKSRFRLPYCSDVGYDGYSLLVELDGRDGHEGTGRFRDMRRDNRFAARHHTTLRFGFFDIVHHPCAVAGQVWSVLADHGLLEPFQHCPRCLHLPLSELVRG